MGIGGKWGFIDAKGQYVINPQFDNAGDFSEGLAAVEIGDRWGFIDTKGQYIVKPQFDSAGPFRAP